MNLKQRQKIIKEVRVENNQQLQLLNMRLARRVAELVEENKSLRVRLDTLLARDKSAS